MRAKFGPALRNRVEASSRLVRGALSVTFVGLLIAGGAAHAAAAGDGSDSSEVSSAASSAAGAVAPATSRTLQGLAPKGWKVDSTAEGDLNKDGRKDCALIVSDQKDRDRRLLIALRGADGLYRKSADARNAVVVECGPSGGVPSVAIKNGVVIVSHYCGSRERSMTDHKYQLRNGQWLLIGFTGESYDANADHVGQKVDVNLLTGDVEGRLWTGKENETRAKFLEVRSPLVNSKEPEVTEWTAPATWLNTKTKDCPIVSVQSIHNKDTVFVRMQLQESYKLSEKDLRLRTAKGQVVEPISVRKTPYGYVIAAFDLKAEPLAGLLSEATAIANDSEPLLRVNVEVSPKECGCTQTFSTDRTAVGGILLTKRTSLPHLADVDFRNEMGPEHTMLWAFPEQ